MIATGSIPTASITESPPSISDHELVRCIGRGSYGQVWLGRNMMGAWRAIKVIYRGEEGTSGFQRELAGIRKFEPVSRNSAGLVHILQIGQEPTQQYFYYVMELADDGQRQEPWSSSHASAIRGDLEPDTFIPRTLSLERRRRGRLPAQECLEIAISLTEALLNLHEHGLVHRDIKPANIIFVQGFPKLADIGLVAEMSEANSYVGTEGYIAPEGPNSPQGDIYSLGKVLYEISTGKDRQDFPEPITVVEPDERKLLLELNAVIMKACAPATADRYRSAADMLSELELIEAGRSVRGQRTKDQRRRWMMRGASAAAGITLLVLAGEKFLDSRVQSIQGESTLIKPGLAGKIAPRSRLAPESAVDLSAYYTAPLIESWYPGPTNNTLSSLPRGPQTIAGINFDVRGLVQLSGREISTYQLSDKYPRQIRGIPLDRYVKRLHFLQGAVSEVNDGARIGRYQVEYASGRTEQIPLIYGKDLRALWQPKDDNGVITNATIAWTGENPATHEREMVLRLYKRTWENPWPDDELVHLDFFSDGLNSAPFLVALSCDPHQPPPGLLQPSFDTLATLQSQAAVFRQVQPALEPPNRFDTYKLKSNPLKMGSEYFDGFRFVVPAERSMDLVWAFDETQSLGSRSWRILPVKGTMKVGFEDWYHGSPSGSEEHGAQLRVQYLNAKKLEPGAEYVILFTFDNNTPAELKACFRFAPPGEVNPNKPETLVRAVGLQTLPEVARLQFHRHYCLGASR